MVYVHIQRHRLTNIFGQHTYTGLYESLVCSSYIWLTILVVHENRILNPYALYYIQIKKCAKTLVNCNYIYFTCTPANAAEYSFPQASDLSLWEQVTKEAKYTQRKLNKVVKIKDNLAVAWFYCGCTSKNGWSISWWLGSKLYTYNAKTKFYGAHTTKLCSDNASTDVDGSLTLHNISTSLTVSFSVPVSIPAPFYSRPSSSI